MVVVDAERCQVQDSTLAGRMMVAVDAEHCDLQDSNMASKIIRVSGGAEGSQGYV